MIIYANEPILILGESGTGKTTSIEHLDPRETFIIAVIPKYLPFENNGYSTIKITKKTDGSYEDNNGNHYCTDNAKDIINIMNYINTNRPEIKTIIIDDFVYLMSNEFMRRISEKTFEKWNEIACHAWSIIDNVYSLRPDLLTIILSHSELDDQGRATAKNIGKLSKGTDLWEGRCNIVFHSLLIDGEYKFLTNNDGFHLAKTPKGMFDTQLIPNDLKPIIERIIEFRSRNKQLQGAA